MKKPAFALATLMAFCLLAQAFTRTATAAPAARTVALAGTWTGQSFPVTNALTGAVTYYNGYVTGTASGDINGSFVLSVAFTGGQPVDAAAGIYSGTVLYPNSSFSLTSGKNNSMSGTINSGLVTYQVNPDGTARILSLSGAALTVQGGKGAYNKATGTGTAEYGTVTAGAGTITLY